MDGLFPDCIEQRLTIFFFSIVFKSDDVFLSPASRLKLKTSSLFPPCDKKVWVSFFFLFFSGRYKVTASLPSIMSDGGLSSPFKDEILFFFFSHSFFDAEKTLPLFPLKNASAFFPSLWTPGCPPAVRALFAEATQRKVFSRQEDYFSLFPRRCGESRYPFSSEGIAPFPCLFPKRHTDSI